jgi:hypothetical protein
MFEDVVTSLPGVLLICAAVLRDVTSLAATVGIAITDSTQFECGAAAVPIAAQSGSPVGAATNDVPAAPGPQT